MNPTVTRRSDGGWHFAWTTSPGELPYSAWLESVLLATINGGTLDPDVVVYDDDPPDIEIVATTDDAGNELYPARFTLEWRGILNADGYVVEQYVAGNWVEVGDVTEAGRGIYTWLSQPQDDESISQFRVRAADRNGNRGASKAFTFEVCRNPLHPSVAFSIASGNVVVEAA